MKFGRLETNGHGYHPDLGGRYVASNANVNIIPLNEACERLLELIEDFPFASLADKCRAIIAIITPALRFGSLLRCHFPAILVEADRPQAGKGTLVEAIQRAYGELNELTSKRKGGVGSFDEEVSKQLLRGRPFIQIDNIRDSLDSEFFEHAMTCPFGATVSARIAADLLKVAIVKIAGVMPDSVHLVATVHDELVYDAPADIAPQCRDVIRQVMIEAFVEMFGTEVPVEVETKVCENWGEK